MSDDLWYYVCSIIIESLLFLLYLFIPVGDTKHIDVHADCIICLHHELVGLHSGCTVSETCYANGHVR